MSDGENKLPDFLAIYQRYQNLKPGPKAELKRAVKPSDLIEIPAFYHTLQGEKGNQQLQRLLFCLPMISHTENGDSLGKALAKANINEKRLFMVIRSEEPNDLIQLRRLLKQVNPTVDWLNTAKMLYYWNDVAKRNLLEDFFYYQTNAKPKATA
ncbi:type I-E CRISPR-associated protein Cse2/CasB [Cycloclasticus zancles]|jgi:CRISPR system Cascade subunit CasB|uniref:Type I-E CRISPR-associated protein Cse2/CasB n=1 Tax=Cycloclasticus zancles 78-ME TaxID=1198232 RepID=S5TZ26_9GAMM|nr:type I-E CRISPR-associated protein Cse2/CasB [Cycloclasticus zancles]AGS40470.1 Type I-E CRISPR-associated protein Cse2/CasB [Cycloclasticus zancles 78-ME]KXJ44526.1 MAG: type I-E CRISPR-associated protein Cse2/CasB [Cycloclasticus sp. Phe_18]